MIPLKSKISQDIRGGVYLNEYHMWNSDKNECILAYYRYVGGNGA